jgi:hypothetical protein
MNGKGCGHQDIWERLKKSMVFKDEYFYSATNQLTSYIELSSPSGAPVV